MALMGAMGPGAMPSMTGGAAAPSSAEGSISSIAFGSSFAVGEGDASSQPAATASKDGGGAGGMLADPMVLGAGAIALVGLLWVLKR